MQKDVRRVIGDILVKTQLRPAAAVQVLDGSVQPIDTSLHQCVYRMLI